MKKQDFIGKLISHGFGFAMTFLIFVGLAIAMVVFLAAVAVVSFFDRLLN